MWNWQTHSASGCVKMQRQRRLNRQFNVALFSWESLSGIHGDAIITERAAASSGLGVHPFREQAPGISVQLHPWDFTLSHSGKFPSRQPCQIICHHCSGERKVEQSQARKPRYFFLLEFLIEKYSLLTKEDQWKRNERVLMIFYLILGTSNHSWWCYCAAELSQLSMRQFPFTLPCWNVEEESLGLCVARAARCIITVNIKY